MRIEGRIFLGVAVFYAILAVVYWSTTSPHEPVGTTALVLSAGLALIVGFYVTSVSRRLPAPRPEDRTDGEIADGAGEVGFFSPHSWWPLAVAIGASVTSLGLAYSKWWLLAIGAVLTVATTIGFVFEYYSGDFARQNKPPLQ